MKNKKNTQAQTKISKGYRLKPSTHRQIKKLQNSLNICQDSVMSMALRLLNEDAKTLRKYKLTNKINKLNQKRNASIENN